MVNHQERIWPSQARAVHRGREEFIMGEDSCALRRAATSRTQIAAPRTIQKRIIGRSRIHLLRPALRLVLVVFVVLPVLLALAELRAVKEIRPGRE